MKRNKLLAFALSLCLTVGLLPSLANAEAKPNYTTVKVESKADDTSTKTTFNVEGSTTPLNDNTIMESKGVKGKIAKAALKAAARTLRSSGLKSTLNGLKYLGFSTTTVNNIMKYSYEVADVLDELSTWSYVVKDTIYQQVSGALGGGTVANDVAWWVATLIDWGFL